VIVTDLARPYSTATVHELQQAMVEDSPHLHKKVGLGDDDTRWTMRKAWKIRGREPEPWMRAEGDRSGSQGQGRGLVGVTRDVPHRPGWPERGDVVRCAATGARQLGQGSGGNHDDLDARDRR